MLANICYSVALLRIRVEDALHHVTCIFIDKFWDFEISAKNFLVKIARVGILEWQVAAYEGKKNDAN